MNNPSYLPRENRIFRTIRIIISIILAVFLANEVYAAGFNVGIIVCGPQWYCTSFTEGTCGTRSCIDVNACGIIDGKPLEAVECPPQKISSKAGGSSNGDTNVPSTIFNNIENIAPYWYFTAYPEIMQIDVEENQSVKKTISILSENNGTYSMSIMYPSNYSDKKTLVSTLYTQQYFSGNGKFDMIIDAKNISTGTKIILLNINNGNQERNVTLAINIRPKKPAITLDLQIDSSIKKQPQDNRIIANLNIKDQYLYAGSEIIYTLLSPNGELVKSITEIAQNNTSSQRENIDMPDNLAAGYYTLVASVTRDGKVYSISKTITILEEKYAIVEQPKKVANNPLWILLIIIVILLIILFTYRYYKNNINIYSYETNDEMKNYQNDKNKRLREAKSRTRYTQLLKKAYAKGFISKTEYDDGLKSLGYNFNSKPENNLDKPKDEERIIKKYQEEKIPVQKDIMKSSNTKITDKTVDESKAFMMHDGRILRSLNDLKKSLENIDEPTFNHHTKEGRNDFANWIAGVFFYEEVSKDVRKAESVKELRDVLAKYF